MRITSIVRFGVAALAMDAFFGVDLPVKAHASVELTFLFKANQLVWVGVQQLELFQS
jgi:hypothetical protein